MTQSQHRLDYARGLVEAQELTENERRDRAIAVLIEQVGELTETVGRLAAEVERLRGGGSEGAGRAAVRAWCPGCGAAIPLPAGASAPLEIACGRCGSVLEVV